MYQNNSTTNAYALGLEGRDDQGRLVVNQENLPNQNPYEFGALAIPIITVNATIFATWFFHRQKNGLNSINKIIGIIFRLEVSKKLTIIIITSILLVYVLLGVDRIEHSVESWSDSNAVKNAAEDLKWPPSLNSFLFGFRYILLSASIHVFGNIRIIPFIESICVLVLTFLITTTIAKKRFSGIVAIVILMQSHLFHTYDTTATYDNSWTLFYLLSLFLIYRFWYLSPIAFFLSTSAKALTALFLPLSFIFISRSDIEKKKKIYIFILYLSTTLPVAIFLLFTYKSTSVYPDQFISGLATSALFLRSDILVVVLLLPLTIGLYIVSKKGYHEADAIMSFITGILLSAPLLVVFTDMTNQPYRFIPLIVFFAIGMGILFSNKHNTTSKKRNYMSDIVFVISIIVIMTNIIFEIFPHLVKITYRISLFN